MQRTIESLIHGFEPQDGGWIYKFGEGYELWFEQLIFDGQWYVALYKDQELLIPKIAVKFGRK